MAQRLLFVVKTVELGGLERHLVDLISRLNSDSNAHCMILCYGENFYARYFGEGTGVRVIARKLARNFLSYWLAFARAGADGIVFVNGYFDEFPLHAYLAARLSGAKRLFAMEQLIADPPPPIRHGPASAFRRLVGWRARYLASKRLQSVLTQKTICISDGVRERLIRDYHFMEKRTVTIPNGVDLERFRLTSVVNRESVRKSLGVRSDEVVIVCAARFEARKRVDLLLHALKIIAAGDLAWKCLIMGSGQLEESLRGLSLKLGLGEAVRFLGFVEDVRPYLEAADIYVSPSEKEGLGLSLVEAMAYQLPCVATNIDGHNEVVVHSHTGLLVPPGSVDGLADAVNRLLVAEGERRRLGLNGRRRAEECFDLEDTTGKFRTVLLGLREENGETKV